MLLKNSKEKDRKRLILMQLMKVKKVRVNLKKAIDSCLKGSSKPM